MHFSPPIYFCAFSKILNSVMMPIIIIIIKRHSNNNSRAMQDNSKVVAGEGDKKMEKDRERERRMRMGFRLVMGIACGRVRDAWRRIEAMGWRRKSKEWGIRAIGNLGVRVVKRKGFTSIRAKAFSQQRAPQLKQRDDQQLNIASLLSPKTDQELSTLCQLIRQTLPISIPIPLSSARHLLQQQLQNQLLLHENRQLREQVDSLNKRQQRQNAKKKESLEMLAQELQEKNQAIEDLRKMLAGYDRKFQVEGDVLESQVQGLRKELEDAQRIRMRLESDLENTKNKVAQLQQSLTKTSSQLKTVQQTLTTTQNSLLKTHLSSQQLEKQSQTLSILIHSIKSKIKQLNFQIASTNQIEMKQIMKQFQAEVKLELVFEYLQGESQGGIGEISYGLFSGEEVDVLERHRREWQANRANRERHVDREEELHGHQVSGIIGKGLHENHHYSIFEVLDDSPKFNAHGNLAKSAGEKIQEGQIERNRFKQQISELKSRFLHIRDVILNLLRSLDIEIGKKSQAQPVLQLIFEIFEYSEQQRSSIFPKRKKFFGFI